MAIKCPFCGFKNGSMDTRPGEKLIVNRFGQSSDGAHIDYILCSSCWRLTLVRASIIKALLIPFGASPYRQLHSIRIEDVAFAANEDWDRSPDGTDIKDVLTKKHGLPPHVLNVLENEGLYSFDELGVRCGERYQDMRITGVYDTKERLDLMKKNRQSAMVKNKGRSA